MTGQERNHALAMLFHKAQCLQRRAVEWRVRDTGVFRSQHRLLMHLSRKPDCSQAQLARELDVSGAAVAVSLTKLEKGGYIHRDVSEADRRTHRLILTPKGKGVVEKSIQMFQEAESAMFAGFSEEEMGLMEKLLSRICDNLRSDTDGAARLSGMVGRAGA